MAMTLTKTPLPSLLLTAFGTSLALLLLLILLSVGFLWNRRRRLRQRYHVPSAEDRQRPITVGVFHPYADGGGGGERVLYCALCSLVKRFSATDSPKLRILLFTGDDGLDATQLLAKSAERFNLPQLLELRVASFVTIVTLPNRQILEPALYPRFTLLWQSVAQMRLAREAFCQSLQQEHVAPQFWIDTTGCPFSFVVASWLYGATVIAYVHYPMISTDMIAQVAKRNAAFNNDSAIASSALKSYGKLLYYRAFALVYGLVGRYCCDVAMVNSSWTFNHIKAIWRQVPVVVYPPCGDMKHFRAFDVAKRERLALSIAQFRPEKNHSLQLRAWKRVVQLQGSADCKLVLLGSCRNQDDQQRVDQLKQEAASLGLEQSQVEFVVNAPFDQLLELLSRSSVGLHTMYNEHFGISIVEMMAAGLVVVANNSGGPRADIVRPGTGRLALTEEEYADEMSEVLAQSDEALQSVRVKARDRSMEFTDEEFHHQFLSAIDHVLPM